MIKFLSLILNNTFRILSVLFLLLRFLPGLAAAVGVDAVNSGANAAIVLAVTGLLRRRVAMGAFMATIAQRRSEVIKL